MRAEPSEKDVFFMLVGRTVYLAAIFPALQMQVFSLIAGQCESDASAAISLN